MSGHKNFKQLNDVSYLRFNFTYKPKVDPKKPRLGPRTTLGLPQDSTVDCSRAKVPGKSKAADGKRKGALPACQLALVTCIFTFRALSGRTLPSLSLLYQLFRLYRLYFLYWLYLVLLRIKNLPENRIENCFNLRKMAHNSSGPCKIYEAQTQRVAQAQCTVFAGSGCCTHTHEERETEKERERQSVT